MLDLLARPQFHFVAGERVEGGLIVLVYMGLGPPTAWRTGEGKPLS
jgi:hypothetical protein